MNALELKIPPAALILIFSGVMWFASDQLPAFALALPGKLAVSIAAGGLGIFMTAAGVATFHAAKTTPNPLRPDTASVLVTSGVYRFSRNPMYVGLLLALGGWAYFLGHPFGFLLLPAFVAYMNRFQISSEERALLTKFGNDFVAHTETVPRWL